jgi:hypothetical protein
MSRKKSLIPGLLILLSVIILTGCGGTDMRPEKALKYFFKQIEQGNLNDISLTIYYMDPNIFTLYPYDIDDVIMANQYKIVIDGTQLEEHIDLLKQMGNTALIPIEPDSHKNVRIYYLFENKKGKKIFDVAMWGFSQRMYVNGLQVEENAIFYDVLLLFLPDDLAEELEKYILNT